MRSPSAMNEPQSAGAEGDAGGQIRTTVFGLDVLSRAPLTLLGESARRAGRPLELEIVDGSALSEWPVSAERVSDERASDGQPIFSIEAHPDAGYLISGPEYGSHRLTHDGQSLSCFPESHPEDCWQRLLVAQALPFAALLAGLEVLHASAVVHERGVIALIGPSGIGKTSLAVELCRRGSRFFADDVLALEATDKGLTAHPGTAVASIEPRAVGHLEPAHAEDVLASNSRERLVRIDGVRDPLPLAGMLFLDRRLDGPDVPVFEEVTDVRMLLAATFNLVLRTPTRLRGLLDVCALAARLPVRRVVLGDKTSVAQLGDAVERWLLEGA